MRRRRQKNTLLPKMIGLAVLINAILLPILAHFGAFKSIGGGQRLTPVELVKAPPPEKRPAPPKKSAKKQASKPKPSGRKSAARSVQPHRAPNGPPPVKVVAAGPSPGGAGGTGDSGIAPSDSGPTAPPTPLATAPAPVTPPGSPPPAPVPPPAPGPTPQSPPAPVQVDAEVLSQVLPTLPSDITYEDIHSSCVAVFTVHIDGSTDVKIVSSTGNTRVDQIALDAARQWRFRPATFNGKPMQSTRRLEIQFYAI